VFAQLRTLDSTGGGRKEKKWAEATFPFPPIRCTKESTTIRYSIFWQPTRLPNRQGSLTCGNNLSTAAPTRWWHKAHKPISAGDQRGIKKSKTSSRDLLAGQGRGKETKRIRPLLPSDDGGRKLPNQMASDVIFRQPANLS
jgi:hypothetical protein